MKSWANTQRNSPGELPPTHPKRRGIFLAFFCAMMARPGRILWSWQLLRLLMRALRPTPRGILQGRGSLLLQCRRSALHPGDFRFTTKVTKGVPGALPLDPVGGHYHPPSSAPRCSPQKGEGAIDADGFATLRWCGQLATPSPLALTKRNILLLIRGSAGFWLHVWMQLWGRFGV